MGGTGCSPATPAAEGVPHGGMGGARTDGGHPVTGPILKKSIAIITDLGMLPRMDQNFQIRRNFSRLSKRVIPSSFAAPIASSYSCLVILLDKGESWEISPQG